MSCHIPLPLGDAADSAYETLENYLSALLNVLESANAHPGLRPFAADTACILGLIGRLNACKNDVYRQSAGGTA